MFFFNNITNSEVTFLIHEFIENEASICFRKQEDNLLQIDFSYETDLIAINQNINGKHLADPPVYNSALEYLSSITLKFQKQTQAILHLEFNHELKPELNFTKRLLLKQFDHDMIISIGVKISILDYQDSNYNYQEFINECTSLRSFKKIEPMLQEKNINKVKFVNKLLEDSKTKTTSFKNNIKNMEAKVNKLVDMELDLKTQNTIANKSDTDISIKKLTIFPEAQESHGIVLYQNGKLQHGDDFGKWIYNNNRLLLFLGKQFIQLINNNGTITDLDGVKWYSIADNRHNKIIKNPINFLEATKEKETWIVLIITCYKRLELAKQVNKTWANDLRKAGLLCLFVVGDMQKTKSKGQEFIQGDILYVNSPDTYEALPSKVIHAFNYCYHNFSFNYLYKVDDDTVVNPVSLLALDLKEKDYIGKPHQVTRDFNRFWHRNKCQNKSLEKIPYPAQRIKLGTIYAKGEAGYFVSYRAVEHLINHMAYINSDLYEDKAIGESLAKENIKLFHHSEYLTKLSEKFTKTRKLDNYCVIVDVGKEIEVIYHHHFDIKIK